jgi:hypothetical protein
VARDDAGNGRWSVDAGADEAADGERDGTTTQTESVPVVIKTSCKRHY